MRDNLIEIITKAGINQEVIGKLANKDNYFEKEKEVSEKFQFNARKELTKEISRNGYEKSYKYNKNGKLIEVLDEDGFKTGFTYDNNSNLIEKTITGGIMPALQDSKVEYEYNELNRLTKRTDHLYTDGFDKRGKEYLYTYDELNRLASETDFEGKTTSLYYDALGNLSTLIYPDKTEVHYYYDSMNRMIEVYDGEGSNKYSYNKLGLRERLDFANGTHEKYTYDKKGRTLSQVTGDKRNVTMTIHDYEYDKNDNITVDVFKNFKTKDIKDVTVRTYAYDELDQLVIEREEKDSYEKSGTETKYFYDLSENIIQKAENKLQTTSQGIFNISPKTEITNYEYGLDNELLKQIGKEETIAYHKSDAFEYEYDKRGNLTGVKDPKIKGEADYITQFYYDGTNKLRYSSDKQNKLTRYSYDGMGRRILKESETILAMTSLILRDKGIRGTKITEQVQNYNESGTNFVTSQNFIYNPISEYDDILLTYGKNMHSQRFVYGAKDKDKGLIKIDSYQKYGNKWNDNMSATYVAPADYINVHYAEETFTKGKAPITQYVIKDIRGSIEQLTSKQGYKAITYTYTAFGEEKFPMNLNDIHGFAGYVRDRETDSYYANARQYLPQIHRFMSKDKLRVDSLNRYLYVMNNPVNLVDPSGLRLTVGTDSRLRYNRNTKTVSDTRNGNIIPVNNVDAYISNGYTKKVKKINDKKEKDKKETFILEPLKSVEQITEHTSVCEKGANDSSNTQNPLKAYMVEQHNKYNEFAKNSMFLNEIPSVTAAGFTGDIYLGTVTFEFVFDKYGNIGYMFTGGLKGKTDIEAEGSIAISQSYTMDNIYDLNGESINFGVSVDTGVGPGGGYTYSVASPDNTKTLHTITVGLNASLIPVEGNAGVTTASVEKLFNVYDVSYDIYKSSVEAKEFIVQKTKEFSKYTQKKVKDISDYTQKKTKEISDYANDKFKRIGELTEKFGESIYDYIFK